MRHEDSGFAAGANTARPLFVGRERPLLRIAASRLVAEAGGDGDRVDLRSVLVALPGSRAGRRLAELLLDEAERRGRALLPPEITTVGALPETFYRPELPAPDPILDTAAWRAALRALEPDEARVLVAHVPEAADDDGWARLARTFRRLHREVASAGWSFHQVAERCAEAGLLFSDEDRWRVLGAIQARYREILEAHGRRDREEARRRALLGGEAVLDRELWLVGTLDVPPVVRRFLREGRTVGPHRVVIPAPPDEADGFDELGCVRPDWWSERDPGLDRDRTAVVDGPREQADAVVRWIAAFGGRHPAEEIAVGVPDPEVRPFLVERIREAGAEVRWAGGRPLHRTALVRLLEALAETLERREYGAFAALLRHPLVEGAVRREAGVGALRAGSLAALADRFHARHLPARLDRGRLPAGGERPAEPIAPELARVRDAVDRLLAPLEGSRPLAEWAPPLQRVLVALHGDEPLDRSREWDRETTVSAASVREVLQAMAALPPSLDAPVPAHRAIRTLLAEVRDGAVPPDPERDAVELVGWLELALDDAEAIAVTGVNEPHLPGAVTADPFLPHALRSRLGLLDNRGRRARDLVHLKMILDGRPDVLLVAGRSDADGNPLRLSRLVLGGPPEEVARRLLAFLGEGRADGDRDPEPAGDAGAGGDEATRPAAPAFPLPPEPVLEAPTPPEQIRVTRFKTILADPYLYALDEILELTTVDDRAREMDGALFGTLAHEALEAWGRGPAAASDDPREIRAALERALERAARDRFGGRPLPAVTLQIEQLRARLGAFADWQAGWRREGWVIRTVEAAPESPGVPFDVDGVPIRLRGRIDRVDHHPERDAWVLLDYKTGDRVDPPDRSHRRGRGRSRRWVDLQLPLYRHLAPALRDDAGDPLIPREAIERLRVGYVALPRERKLVCEALASWTPDELDEADETARDVVRLLRENRFEFERGSTRARRGSPLAPLLGQGVMAALDEAEEEGFDA